MSIRTALTGLLIVLSFLSKSTCTFVPSVLTTTLNTCSDLCNGTAVISISGTTGPYVITGAGSPVTTTGTPVTVMGLCGGVNTLLVTDAGGCSTPVIVTIVGPSPLSLSCTVASASGGCTGIITASSAGGTFPHVYSLDGGPYQVSPIFNSVCAGVHTLCVMDVNGCTNCIPVTMTVSCSMVSTVGGIVSPLCHGDCNGSAIIASTLGTAPYTAVLSPGGATFTYTGSTAMTGLCAGTYIANVTDAMACTSSYTFTISEPTELVVVPTTTPGAGCTGSITVSSSGGTGPYVYSVDGGTTWSPTSVFSGLCAGTYTACVQDASGCVDCMPVTLVPSCTMVSTVFPSSYISCYGNCDGMATLITSGGTLPYTVIDPTTGATVSYSGTTTFTGLCAGTYTFYVTDAVGCNNTQILTMTEPTELVVSASATNETSLGSNDGSISITASGGTSPYTYSIDGGVTWFSYSVFAGLTSGSYNVCVMDAHGCMQCTPVVIYVSTGCTLSATVNSIFPATCHGGCDGLAIFNISGGTAPYAVTVGTSTYTSSGVATVPGLCAGTYTATITDAGGCSTSLTFTVTEPSAIVTTIFPVSNPSGAGMCDGVIHGTASGGTPAYSYMWVSCPSMSSTGITSASPDSGFCAGMYAMVVVDANGCADTSTCVTLSVPTGLSNMQTESIDIYPNPTSGILKIRSAGPVRMVLTDLFGERVLDKALNGESVVDLNVAGIRNGIYFVTLLSDDKIVHAQKIVLTR